MDESGHARRRDRQELCGRVYVEGRQSDQRFRARFQHFAEMPFIVFISRSLRHQFRFAEKSASIPVFIIPAIIADFVRARLRLPKGRAILPPPECGSRKNRLRIRTPPSACRQSISTSEVMGISKEKSLA